MGGAEYSAKVIGVDQDKDVAVLQVRLSTAGRSCILAVLLRWLLGFQQGAVVLTHMCAAAWCKACMLTWQGLQLRFVTPVTRLLCCCCMHTRVVVDCRLPLAGLMADLLACTVHCTATPALSCTKLLVLFVCLLLIAVVVHRWAWMLTRTRHRPA
eukprot:GHRQ01024500.1.p1 GENE.GHRQ01024500.1~~GHRQ01024500.1.p1  ORF type:complete len:155 (-),score=21.19 GHRQ01024500.1:237-701(-)